MCPASGVDQILAVVLVQQGDAINAGIEVGSAAELGFVEHAAVNNFGVLLVSSVGIDISHIGGDNIAVDGEGGGIKHVDGAVLQASQHGVQLLLGAGGNILAQLGQSNGAVLQVAGPVEVDGSAVLQGQVSLIINDEAEPQQPAFPWSRRTRNR